MTVAKFVGEKIKQMRTTFGVSGMSQEDLAKRLGVTPNTVSRWETAVYKPKLEDLDKLARVFGVTISAFFPKEEVQTNNALLRAAKAAEDLPEDDKQAIQDFIEFKRAQHKLKK